MVVERLGVRRRHSLGLGFLHLPSPSAGFAGQGRARGSWPPLILFPALGTGLRHLASFPCRHQERKASALLGKGTCRFTPWPLQATSPLAGGLHLPASLTRTRQVLQATKAGSLRLISRFIVSSLRVARLPLALPRWWQNLAGLPGKASPQPLTQLVP